MPHCVRGRARNAPHKQIQRVADSLPTLSYDYGFLGTDGAANDDAQIAAGFSPVLVMHDEISGSVFAHAVPRTTQKFTLQCEPCAATITA